MESIKRLSELAPSDLSVVERVFGRPLDALVEAELVLRIHDSAAVAAQNGMDDVPAWCNVLEGMSEEDLADFDAILNTPIRLANPAA